MFVSSEIEGKHILTNPSFCKVVLEAALEQMNYLEVDEYAALTLSRIIVKQLKIPMGEIMLVMNVIAPKTTLVKKSFLLSSLAAFGVCKDETVGENDDYTDRLSMPKPLSRTQKLEEIKKKILEMVDVHKILPESFLKHKLENELKEASISNLSNLLRAFETSKLIYANGYIAAHGYDPSMEAMNKLLLDENGHKPFNINIIAGKYALSIEDVKNRLKKRRFGDLILWDSYQVWSIADIRITETAIERIKNNVAAANGRPLLLRDIFHIVLVGVVPENAYGDIELSAKKDCAMKGLHAAGIFGYTFNAVEEKFYSDGPSKKDLRPPLYKIFGRK